MLKRFLSQPEERSMQSRTFVLLSKKAHIGEVSATVWPKVLKDMCRKKNIHVIE